MRMSGVSGTDPMAIATFPDGVSWLRNKGFDLCMRYACFVIVIVYPGVFNVGALAVSALKHTSSAICPFTVATSINLTFILRLPSAPSS
jgi:hypothetical protein